MFRRLSVVGLLLVGFGLQAQDREAVQHFEEKIRPLLAAKCQGCHSDATKMSGLSLMSREAAMLGGNKGSAVIPGQAESSLLVQAIAQQGELKMPPGGPLPPEEVALLTEWVASGAAWGEANAATTRATASHWAFQSIERHDAPKVEDARWVRNRIDAFVLARLEKEDIAPSPEASKRTLLRRLSLDLVGLPPTPEEIRAFLADTEPGAYVRQVDRLLASSHYGERWGRHWLDIAHYADSNGYSIDSRRPMWKYRDWVIKALNADMPFDRFCIEQIAGDLLPEPTLDQQVATGFFRNTMVNEEGGIDFEQYRVEAVVDRVNTTGAAFLGLTVGCARCHDHKFDPVSQAEFYKLYAFFNDVDELSGEFTEREGRARMLEPILEFGSDEEFTKKAAVQRQIEMLEAELREYEAELDKQQAEWEENITEAERKEIKPSIVGIIDTPREDRSSVQEGVFSSWYRKRDPAWVARSAGIRALRGAQPKLDSTLVMRDLPKPREAYIHVQGDFTRKGDVIQPGTPGVLPGLDTDRRANRLDLAKWLVDANNPLTARVTMNRVWQRYFGLGIVETENDFGSQGTSPSHPELLDWLASEFIRQDWSLKAMHRTIVTSATYRQASAARPELATKDPQNRLLARQNRVRLEAEIVRDAGLVASGLFSPKIGGPSVFPPQPEGLGKFTQNDRKWKASDGEDRYRRGMYTFFWRSAAHPGLTLFDAPNAQQAVTRRNRSNTPLQGLWLLNDEAHIEMARALGQRAIDSGDERDARIDFVFEAALGRNPSSDERARLSKLIAGANDDFATNPDSIGDATGDHKATVELAAWTTAARVLLNLDEFVTRP